MTAPIITLLLTTSVVTAGQPQPSETSGPTDWWILGAALGGFFLVVAIAAYVVIRLSE